MGKLIVLEGPDFVGKTTLAKKLSELLSKNKIENLQLSFPGNIDGTLGKFIHDFHHNHNMYGIKTINNFSLQMLHVAAHVDSIGRDILPALEKDKTIILDRYWWSTYVYGEIGQVNKEYLDKLLALEELAWKKVNPDLIILIDAEEPYSLKVTEEWNRLRNSYHKLYQREKVKENVICIINNSTLDDLFEKTIEAIGEKHLLINL
ncbi:MAG: hypothetical protein WD037_05645 [Balneolales bacterium]